MSEYQILAVLAAFAFLYSLVASRLERTPFSGALVYLVVGLACGPAGLALIDLDLDAKGISWLAELTLAIVLFTDSANADTKVIRQFERIPARLLLIGLPLTIALGAVFGRVLFPELTIFEVALLATMLAPTDAALGKPVVTNPSVPASVRESLNVESGLNDGICVPVLLFFLACSTGDASGSEKLGLTISLPLQAIGIGAVVGLLLGLLGSFALRTCARRDWIGGSWLQIPVIALSLLCFALAQELGGSGFIASFVGGMTFGTIVRKHKGEVLEAAEGTGDVFAMLTWFAFGTMLPAYLNQMDWRVLLYAVASLTIVRILPVCLSVTGRGLRLDTKLFIGWFGPRGLASIVFAVMVLDGELTGGTRIVATTLGTILLSVILHGLSANPLAKIYSKRVAETGV